VKVLLVHNRYQIYGGEDTVFNLELKALKDRGVTVLSYVVDNMNIHSLSDKLSVALHVHKSKYSEKMLRDLCHKFMPDVVHVHNFFPQITPVIFDVCSELNIPTVLTLHNFRLICPNGLLLREQNPCEICITKSAYHAIPYKCYRNSLMGTAVVAHMVEYHRKHHTWQDKVDVFIALSEFSKTKFIKSAFPEHKILVKPNFIPSLVEGVGENITSKEPLFLARLSIEKGVDFLASAWDGEMPNINVIGDGPLRAKLEARSNMSCLGKKSHDEALKMLKCSRYLVMTSQCYENCPMTILEAFRAEVPVVAPRLGAMKEMIKHEYNGLLYQPGDVDDFKKKIKSLENDPCFISRMSDNARVTFEEKYSESVHNIAIDVIYNAAINQKSRAQ
jgi:glycosyltransferase involved in cell wall biosynthesis